MKTKEEKIKILTEAIKILAEEVDDTISGEEVPDYPPPSVTEWPSPSFDKYRTRLLALQNKGYTMAGIARELGCATSNVSTWIHRLGLTPNKNTKNAPGSYLSKKKSLTGRKQKYVLLTTQEQNERLKVEQENAE
jgi:transposase-like protein